MTICCLVNLDVDGLDHAHDLGQIDLDLYGILETWSILKVLFVAICCLVDFDVDGLDHAHGLGQIVLSLDGVSETFDPSWTSFICDILLFGKL